MLDIPFKLLSVISDEEFCDLVHTTSETSWKKGGLQNQINLSLDP